MGVVIMSHLLLIVVGISIILQIFINNAPPIVTGIMVNRAVNSIKKKDS
jgi:hypothetical protein